MVDGPVDLAASARCAAGGLTVAALCVALQPGDLLVLPESEYRYGVGPVIARIKTIYETVEYRDEMWWYAKADVADGDPTNHGGLLQRDLYIRQASIQRIRQVPHA